MKSILTPVVDNWLRGLLLLLVAPTLPQTVAGSLPRVHVAGDRSGFTVEGRPFAAMGVNYFRPGTGWAPQVWQQFDPDATRRDFAKLKAVGGNCVRVFLTYGSFMTEPGVVDERGLEKLDRFIDLAEEAGLYVHPTGPDHWEGLPEWARTDRIADETVLRALEGFWRTVATRYRERSAVFAYDLLNEPAVGWDTPAMAAKWNAWLAARYDSAAALANAWGMRTEEIEWANVAAPPRDAAPGARLLDYQYFRESLAVEWTRRQTAAIKAADPDALVTVGLIQWSVPAVPGPAWLYSGFRPAHQAPFLDFMEVHFYPLAPGFYEYAGEADEARNLAYLESVVREVAACSKPVVLAEFGWYGGGKLTIDNGRHPFASEAQQARWSRRVVETTRGWCQGWLNWGLHDHPEARDVTQYLGLFTADGVPKAWSRTFARLADRMAGETSPLPSIGERPALDWDACLQDRAAAERFREDYYRAWAEAMR